MRAGKSESGEGGVVSIESGFGGASGNISMKSASSKDDRSGSLTLSTGSSESSGGTGEVLILSGDAAGGDLVAGSVKIGAGMSAANAVEGGDVSFHGGAVRAESATGGKVELRSGRGTISGNVSILSGVAVATPTSRSGSSWKARAPRIYP